MGQVEPGASFLEPATTKIFIFPHRMTGEDSLMQCHHIIGFLESDELIINSFNLSSIIILGRAFPARTSIFFPFL